MARGRCKCGESDCPDCGLKNDWYQDDDPVVEDVDNLPSIPPSDDEDEDIKSWAYDVGIRGC